MGSKAEAVRSVFGEPGWYLKGTCNIRIRVETVREFLKNESFDRILDIGCGDGSISLPLLSAQRHLTLLDFSEGMLAVAGSRVPAELAGNVEIRNENFMDAKLSPGEYDLVICVGVLAHADAPEALIRKIVSLMRPGGNLILEQTDASHFMSDLTYVMEKYFFVPENYERNRISSADVRRIVAECGLDPVASFRYSLLLPGMHRLVSENGLYKMIRLVYGSYPCARLSHLGNECIYHLKSTARLKGTPGPLQRLN
jgi:SAM-dependent methyltransferase